MQLKLLRILQILRTTDIGSSSIDLTSNEQNICTAQPCSPELRKSIFQNVFARKASVKAKLFRFIGVW